MTAQPTLPTYEDAHREADTLFPRGLWDEAFITLQNVRTLFWELAEKEGARLYLVTGPKHPHPACILRRTGTWKHTELAVWAEPVDAGSIYRAGIKEWKVIPILGVTRSVEWKPLRVLSGADLNERTWLAELVSIANSHIFLSAATAGGGKTN